MIVSEYAQRVCNYLKDYKALCEKYKLCVTGGIGGITALIETEKHHNDWLKIRILEMLDGESSYLRRTEREWIEKELGY